MKGLIRKDMIMLWKYAKAILIIVAVFTLVSFTGNNDIFFVSYPGIITGMLPMTLLTYDEMERFCPWCDSLPVTRKQYVSAKYLVGLIIGGGTVGVILISQILRVIVSGGHWSDLWSLILFVCGMNILAPAVMLPFAFRFGTQKGRLVYYVVIGGSFAATSITAQNGGFSGSAEGGMTVFFFAAAVIYLLSWLLSVKFYQKREM
ncbi:MAG: ABC-2 transporter permease [Oscillospiraceae bacterium]|nr:ABC-2 transporter permease [Oscillospiraceae bacterium]